MGLIRALASFCLISPVKSALSKGQVLRIGAAGRRSPNDLARHLRDNGIEVHHVFMYPDNTLRFKVDDAERARRLIEEVDHGA